MDRTMVAAEKMAKLLNLQGQYIEEIDQVPPKYKKIDSLILSNNHLRSLRGVEQFPKLKKLIACDNAVTCFFACFCLISMK